MRYFVKIDKLEKLGWKENINFNNGIDETIKWYINKILLNKDFNIDINNILEFKNTLDFNTLKLSNNLKLLIDHNLPLNYSYLLYNEKLLLIQNNILLNLLYNNLIKN